AFLEGYKGYPKGSKAPDNLLKLGMSLAALNRQGEACTTFTRLAKEFPDAPSNLKAVTENERKKLSCPG
ncbi:MAG: tetratricopeptide repeat protein, partial [Chloroflexota bacterium]